MANKNDKSDLIEFSFFTIILIIGFIALARYGFSLIDKKYFQLLDAKLSEYGDYVERQWRAGGK